VDSVNPGRTHRLLVEVRGNFFGADESVLNISFDALTSGSPFVYVDGWKQTAKTIHVPSEDIFTRNEIINAPTNSKLYLYSTERNGVRSGFRSFTEGTRLFFWCPPGQGKDLVVRVTRRVASGSVLASASSNSKAGFTYSTPVVNDGGVYTESPYRYAPANSGPTGEFFFFFFHHFLC
jgi:hypothetical protein